MANNNEETLVNEHGLQRFLGKVVELLKKYAVPKTWAASNQVIITDENGKISSKPYPILGTAAPLDVPAEGDATSTQVVKGDDTRLEKAKNISTWALVTFSDSIVHELEIDTYVENEISKIKIPQQIVELSDGKRVSDLEDGKVDKKDGYDLVSNSDIAQITTNLDNIISIQTKLLSLEGDTGIINKYINAALNKWATALTENDIIDTYAEAINWIAEHGAEYTALVTEVGKKVEKVEGKGLSTEDFTTAFKEKLEALKLDANANIIEEIKVNNIVQTPVNKSVNIEMPTKTSDLTNDGADGTKPFLTEHQDITGKADVATTLAGYGITDAATSEQGKKADSAIQTIKINGVEQTKTDGEVDLPAYPTSLPASDVPNWAKAENKPSYTASEIGLENVDNTSDADKPISTATQAALDDKIDKIDGKGLSTEDFTTELKTKLDTVKIITDEQIADWDSRLTDIEKVGMVDDATDDEIVELAIMVNDDVKKKITLFTLVNDIISTTKDNFLPTVKAIKKIIEETKNYIFNTLPKPDNKTILVKSGKTELTEVTEKIIDLDNAYFFEHTPANRTNITVTTNNGNLSAVNFRGSGRPSFSFIRELIQEYSISNEDFTSVTVALVNTDDLLPIDVFVTYQYEQSIEDVLYAATATSDSEGIVKPDNTTITIDNGVISSNFSQEEKEKLANIDAEANKYELPAASMTALGGVKIDGTTITIDENGVISSSGSSSSGGGNTNSWTGSKEEWESADHGPIVDGTQVNILNDSVNIYDKVNDALILIGKLYDKATNDNLGLVRPDGDTITIDDDGVIKGTPGILVFETKKEWDAFDKTTLKNNDKVILKYEEDVNNGNGRAAHVFETEEEWNAYDKDLLLDNDTVVLKYDNEDYVTDPYPYVRSHTISLISPNQIKQTFEDGSYMITTKEGNNKITNVLKSSQNAVIYDETITKNANDINVIVNKNYSTSLS